MNVTAPCLRPACPPPPLQVCLTSQCSSGPLQPALYHAGQLAAEMGVDAGPHMTPGARVMTASEDLLTPSERSKRLPHMLHAQAL